MAVNSTKRSSNRSLIEHEIALLSLADRSFVPHQSCLRATILRSFTPSRAMSPRNNLLIHGTIAVVGWFREIVHVISSGSETTRHRSLNKPVFPLGSGHDDSTTNSPQNYFYRRVQLDFRRLSRRSARLRSAQKIRVSDSCPETRSRSDKSIHFDELFCCLFSKLASVCTSLTWLNWFT